MRYLIVEGITDVAFVKYVCFKNKITNKFNEFSVQSNQGKVEIYKNRNLFIINLKGQNNLNYVLLEIIKNLEMRIEKIGIIQDADDNFEKSKQNIETAINNSEIDKSKIDFFLTPNNKDEGDLETLLLSTLDENRIPQLKCFKEYKDCLNKHIDITTKAMDKAKLYSYTMFSKNGKNYYTPQNSFMYKNNKKYKDTELWDLSKDEFQPIIDFISSIFRD